MINDLRINFLELIELGGDVLWPLFGVCLVMWTLIVERFVYFIFVHPQKAKAVKEKWFQRRDRRSWYAHKIRDLWISELTVEAKRSTSMIKTMVALCPLLGLLGTVLGMLEVFHVISVAGSGNVRAMASGVSAATVSTMAGMVAALSGLFFSVRITRWAEQVQRRLSDDLVAE